jgi:hypothetical protein
MREVRAKMVADSALIISLHQQIDVLTEANKGLHLRIDALTESDESIVQRIGALAETNKCFGQQIEVLTESDKSLALQITKPYESLLQMTDTLAEFDRSMVQQMSETRRCVEAFDAELYATQATLAGIVEALGDGSLAGKVDARRAAGDARLTQENTGGRRTADASLADRKERLGASDVEMKAAASALAREDLKICLASLDRGVMSSAAVAAVAGALESAVGSSARSTQNLAAAAGISTPRSGISFK